MFGKNKNEEPKKSRQEKQAEAQAKAARTGACSIYCTVGEDKHGNGAISFDGKQFPVAGATSYVENGAATTGRMTATRVATGAVLLGPLGAVLGGMAKKDRNKVYLVVELPDGSVLSKDFPAKDEPKVREFSQKVNTAGNYWAGQE